MYRTSHTGSEQQSSTHASQILRTRVLSWSPWKNRMNTTLYTWLPWRRERDREQQPEVPPSLPMYRRTGFNIDNLMIVNANIFSRISEKLECNHALCSVHTDIRTHTKCIYKICSLRSKSADIEIFPCD